MIAECKDVDSWALVDPSAQSLTLLVPYHPFYLSYSFLFSFLCHPLCLSMSPFFSTPPPSFPFFHPYSIVPCIYFFFFLFCLHFSSTIHPIKLFPCPPFIFLYSYFIIPCFLSFFFHSSSTIFYICFSFLFSSFTLLTFLLPFHFFFIPHPLTPFSCHHFLYLHLSLFSSSFLFPHYLVYLPSSSQC